MVQPYPERHKVCPHTQQAARSRIGAFKTEVERTFPDLPKKQVSIIANLATMTLCQLEETDMPEIRRGPAILYEPRPKQPA